MAGEFVTALKDAFRWDALNVADSRTALAVEQWLLPSRSRMLRAGFVGVVAGALITLVGYRVGMLVEEGLDGVTGGAWGYFSSWLGDLGLVPFIFCGMGSIVALLGVYRLMTAAVPALAGSSRLARFTRITLIAIFGAAAVVAAAIYGFIRLPQS